MEKRYYFRGLGLGIIVTAVIMGIALSGSRSQRAMTDDEVIARAKKLGMIEDSRLLTPSDSDKEENNTNEADAQENGETKTVQTPVKMDVAVANPEPEDASGQESGEADAIPATDERPVAETKPDTNEMNKQDEDTPSVNSEASSVKMGSITVVSGDGSYKVAQKLVEAGIVNSAASFDDFLCENGYDKRLRTGTFQIPVDASDEQIARIVTGQE